MKQIQEEPAVEAAGATERLHRMVTVKTAADMLGIAKNTLDKARVYGGPNAIPYAKFGKRVLYNTRDIALHIEANTITNTCQRDRF